MHLNPSTVHTSTSTSTSTVVLLVILSLFFMNYTHAIPLSPIPIPPPLPTISTPGSIPISSTPPTPTPSPSETNPNPKLSTSNSTDPVTHPNPNPNTSPSQTFPNMQIATHPGSSVPSPKSSSTHSPISRTKTLVHPVLRFNSFILVLVLVLFLILEWVLNSLSMKKHTHGTRSHLRLLIGGVYRMGVLDGYLHSSREQLLMELLAQGREDEMLDDGALEGSGDDYNGN
ncbi:hypothetical protein GGU11DRAFT_748519 [Lentinula aff. detonsa]|nr:hypothetical protein GGU11DRAFT_748519 [Lentinula aff. detonsa]